MSGLEISALVAGIIGASAGTISAYKDMKKKRGIVGGSFHELERTWNDGRTKKPEKITVATRGPGEARVNANGDVFARSSAGGSALAIFVVKRQSYTSSGSTLRRRRA